MLLTADREQLQEMNRLAARAAPLHRPSEFWQKLSAWGEHQLETSGVENLKRTINMRYFNWRTAGILSHQLLPLLRSWLLSPKSSAFRSKFLNPKSKTGGAHSFGTLEASLYRIFVTLLWDFTKQRDPLGLTDTLSEPRFGNPFLIELGGVSFSQDLANSILEFYASTEEFRSRGQTPTEILEIGAGYGRLAWVMLNVFPTTRYTIVDIPPALFLSQKYLHALFPEKTYFFSRPFESFSEVREEFCSAQIHFLMPSQLELLPDEMFDLTLNVSSLHEMTKEQIEFYFCEIDRVCSGYFYSKQWRTPRPRLYHCVLSETEYPVPAQWTTMYHRRHDIQSWYFEALYQTRIEGGGV